MLTSLNAWLSTPSVVIISVGALVGMAASLLGVLLVLRRTSMLTDAIAHSVLLGIVLMFFIVRDSASPLLLLGAAAAGVLCVFLTELLIDSKRVKHDAAIGLVFPALFALAVLLISLYARDVHLDEHAVLLGEIAFTWLDTISLGPLVVARALLVMGVITLVNALFLLLFYKELKLVTFDPALALALGISPTLFHYLLLSFTSITAVGAFDAVGAILFVAFVVVPPSAAYLLTDKLWQMIVISLLIALGSSFFGYYAAITLDVSIGGMMASMTGGFLLLSFLFSPRYGLIAQSLRMREQRLDSAERMLLAHLYHHEQNPDGENAVSALHTHLRWPAGKIRTTLRRARRHGTITLGSQEEILLLTEEGRQAAKSIMAPWLHTEHRSSPQSSDTVRTRGA